MDLHQIVIEDGYTWVVFPDEAWAKAELVEWTEGYPWFTRRQ